MVDYDSIVAVRESLRSLEAFNELVAARHHAGYCHNEKHLNEWILKGVWLMDHIGNTGRLEVFPGHKAHLIDLPEIMTPEKFRERFPKVDFYFDGVFLGIPPAGSVCARCRRPWTMENCHLARHHKVSNDTSWIADKRYVGKRYDEIPRATIESDGIIVRIKPTTLIVKNGAGTVRTVEGELKYDYTLDSTDMLPFSLVHFEHVDSCI